MPAMSPLLIEYIQDAAVVTFMESAVIEAQHIERIRRDLDDLVDKRDQRRLVLDMSKVSQFSSAALGMLISLEDRTAKRKGKLILCGLRPDIRQVFKITKLEKMFTFADTEAHALELLGVSSAGL